MTALYHSLLDRILLWHGTTQEIADRILAEGMRPSKKADVHTHKEGSWLYHATPTNTQFKHGVRTFMFGVDLRQYARGRDYVHQNIDTVVFKVPLPTDSIVACLDSSGHTLKALEICWGDHVMSDLVACCKDEGIAWRSKLGLAEIVWTLAPEKYLSEGLPGHMLAAEVPGMGLADAARLISPLKELQPRFLHDVLRLYHRTYLTPRLARAAMVAGAKHATPAAVLSNVKGDKTTPSSQCTPEIADFLQAVLPQLPQHELARGALEMASLRRFPGTEDHIGPISNWLCARAFEFEEVAFHYVQFAGDTSEIRDARRARHLAAEILAATGRDYFSRLSALTHTDYSEALKGVMYTFASLRDERGVPFIAAQLDDSRKMHRVAAVEALERIGTPDALEALQSVAKDRRKVVRSALEQALGNSEATRRASINQPNSALTLP